MSLSDSSVAFTFDPDHPCNTQVKDNSTGKVLFRVKTEVLQPHAKTVTTVRRTSGETIATFEWRDFKSDIVTFGSGPPIIASDWLKKSSIPFRDTVTWKDDRWKSYKWKGFGPGLSLELYSDSSKSLPLARFTKPRTPTVITNHKGTPASLQLHPSLASLPELRDQIVLSFLYLEKTRRQRDDDDFNVLPRSRHRP